MRKVTKAKRKFKTREARRQHMLRIKNIDDVNNLTKQQALQTFKDFVKEYPQYDKDGEMFIEDFEEDEQAFLVDIVKYYMRRGYSLGRPIVDVTDLDIYGTEIKDT